MLHNINIFLLFIFLCENSFSKIMKVPQIQDSYLLLWVLLLPASVPLHSSSFHSFLFCCFQKYGNLLSEVSWLNFLPCLSFFLSFPLLFFYLDLKISPFLLSLSWLVFSFLPDVSFQCDAIRKESMVDWFWGFTDARLNIFGRFWWKQNNKNINSNKVIQN